MLNFFLDELSWEYPSTKIIGGLHKATDLHRPDGITLMYLPPYSPELNPVEKLWQWLRKEVTHNALFRTLETVHDVERDYLPNIRKSLVEFISPHEPERRPIGPCPVIE